jgi:succinate dehydrogenase flavin-adding protein (antitoxin of CptAB toxin-antitoxin module)
MVIEKHFVTAGAEHRDTYKPDWSPSTFVDRHLAGLAVYELRQFEGMLQESDPALSDWMSESHLVPKKRDGSVMALLRRFFALRRV